MASISGGVAIGCYYLTNADVRYDSIRGRIETAWKKSGGKLTLNVTIPANTTVTVLVPAKSADAIAVSEMLACPGDDRDGLFPAMIEKTLETFTQREAARRATSRCFHYWP